MDLFPTNWRSLILILYSFFCYEILSVIHKMKTALAIWTICYEPMCTCSKMLLIIMFCKKWIFCWKITICLLICNDFLSKWGKGDERGLRGRGGGGILQAWKRLVTSLHLQAQRNHGARVLSDTVNMDVWDRVCLKSL